MKRRISILLLSLVLLLGMLPTIVFADGQNHTAGSAAELATALSQAANGDTITLTGSEAEIDFSTWQAVILNKAITLDGNGKTLTGLTEPLFAISSAKAVIKNLTVADSAINGANVDDALGNTGYGAAFVGYVSEGSNLVIENCHVKNTTITSDMTDSNPDQKFSGGFIGFTTGGTVVDLFGCSIDGVSVTSGGSAGGFVGHLYGTVRLMECESKGINTVSCTEIDGGTVPNRPDKVGAVAGRINAGVLCVDVTDTSTTTLSPASANANNDKRVIGNIAGGEAVITGGEYHKDPTLLETLPGRETVPTVDGHTSTDGGKYKVVSWQGAGTSADPYQIATADDLARIARRVAVGFTYENTYFKITADTIDLSGIGNWAPIGLKDAEKEFCGIFDGDGKTVTGLAITAAPTGEDYVALFGCIGAGAHIKNLTVGGTVSGVANAAGIVARMNGGTVENCINKVNVTATSKAGGVVCLMNKNAGSLIDCKNEGTVKAGNAGTAGIVGYVNSGNTITGCENNGTVGVSTDKYAGGIVGYSSTGNITVTNCTNTGAISGQMAGGILGIVTGGTAGTFTGCENEGAVTGTGTAGGIVGGAQNGVFRSCVNTGTVSGTTAGGIGGAVASVTIEATCNANGATVTGTYAGRILGNAYGGPDGRTLLYVADRAQGDTLPTVASVGSGTIFAGVNIAGGTLYGDVQVVGTAGCSNLLIFSQNAQWTDGTDTIVYPSGKTYTCKVGQAHTFENVGAVAKVGDYLYVSLADAISVSSAGGTVTLVSDVQENFALDKSLTLALGTYDLQGKITAGKDVKLTVSGTGDANDIVLLSLEDKTGYTFGWYTAEGVLADEVTGGFKVAPTATGVTYEAKWTINEYTISYTLNSGTVEGTNPGTYTVDSNTITLINPTRPGYTFTGWTGTGLSAATKDVTIAKGSTGDRTYTANWTLTEYTVAYDLGGGTVNGTNPLKYTVEDGDFTLVNPEKTGYTFAGWTGSNGATAQTAVTVDTAGLTNLSYTANWTPNTYTVTFDVNEGEALATDTKTVTYDSTYGELPVPKRTGFAFAGWYTAKTDGTKIDADTKVKITDNTTVLYALWTQKETLNPTWTQKTEKYTGNVLAYAVTEGYTVSYQQNGEAASPVNAGTYDVVISRPEDETYVAYSTIVYDGLVIEKASPTVEITADKTVIAGAGNVILTVDGAPVGATVLVECDGNVSITENGDGTYTVTLPNENKVYTFTVTYAGDENHNGDTDTCTVVVRQYTFVPAPSYYILYFNTNGGTAIGSVQAVSGAIVDLSGYVPVREGYTFTGWFSDVALTRKVSFVQVVFDTTVYAGWTKNETAPVNPFGDVFADDWYYADVLFAYENGLMEDTGDGMFSPSIATTRGMIATILWRLEGKPDTVYTGKITDVPAGKYYSSAMDWAAAYGILEGYGDGVFGPEDAVTREQMVTILFRYAKYKGVDVSSGETGSIADFKDGDSVSDYALSTVKWAVAEGIIGGYDGYLTPTGDAKRCEVAAILHRYCNWIAK